MSNPMSSSSFHNFSARHRSSTAHSVRRRPLARSNSSLLGTIKNIVTAPLAWFATTDDFDDSPDLKGKRRRNAAMQPAPSSDESEGPRPKRARVKSPDSQIQFHPEPQYVAPNYPQAPARYLDPPEISFGNSNIIPRSSSVTLTAPTPNHFNFGNRSGLTRTMSIDPPAPTPMSREPSMSFAPLERETSMERSSLRPSSIQRDLSMPLPATGSIRMRTSLTPQPAQTREVSEPPSYAALAQKPVFVRAPVESHQRFSSQSSTSTLGSLVESQRRTRSPMRQHSSSLLFGSGSHSQDGESSGTRQTAPAERALHELDIYRTPLLPTRSRLRAGPSSPSGSSFPSGVSKAVDPTDLFRPRRSSQLLLMRDDRRASMGRKSGYSFLDDVDEAKEREAKNKAKVNDTKPYAGEGGMKKLLARRMKEVQEAEDDDAQTSSPQSSSNPSVIVESKANPVLPPPLPSAPLDLPKVQPSQSGSSGSSLRVGRTKTSRNHIARPGRPATKFSAAYEEDDAMDDGEDLERQKERQELEEASKKLPTFEVPAGFSFAKEQNVQPPIEQDENAKEPPIAALPFSFSKPSVSTVPAAPVPVPVAVPVAPQPVAAPAADPPPKSLPAFSFERGPETVSSAFPEKATEPSEKASAPGIPNFFSSSKLLSQVSAPSTLLPPAIPSFSVPSSTPTPAPPESTPTATVTFPSASVTTPSLTPSLAATPIKDTENPFWVGDAAKKDSANVQPSLLDPKTNSGGDAGSALRKPDGAPTSLFASTLFGGAKKDAPPPASSLFGTSGAAGFSFGAPSVATTVDAPVAPSLEAPKVEEAPKLASPFGSGSETASEASKPSLFSFGAPSSTGAPAFGAPTSTTGVESAAPFSFASSAPVSNPFATTAAPEAPRPGSSFAFGQPQKEATKSTPAASSPFTFGAPASPAIAADPQKPATGSAPFSFGPSAASAPATTSSFSFGTGATNNDSSSKAGSSSSGMFSFGSPAVMAPLARPVTPPRNEVPEFKMDESPTRDVQPPNNPSAKPASALGTGFSFTSPASTSTFGQPAATAPSPFSFNAPSTSNSNPFAASSSTENKPFGGPSAPTPFAFGQNTSSGPIEPPRPSTTGSFSFGAPSTSSSTPFSFGSGNTSGSNPFASGGSAPSSPSTFSQPFSFGAGAPQQSTPFAFGSSQPASPAGAASNLPQPTTPGGFGSPAPFGSGGGGGGSLFTIGAAPAPQRVVKKLPRRNKN